MKKFLRVFYNTRWKKLLVRRLALLIGVFTASWVLEIVTNRSHVVGKGGELILTSVIDHFFFGAPPGEEVA